MRVLKETRFATDRHSAHIWIGDNDVLCRD
jgi:hypothetical protein